MSWRTGRVNSCVFLLVLVVSGRPISAIAVAAPSSQPVAVKGKKAASLPSSTPALPGGASITSDVQALAELEDAVRAFDAAATAVRQDVQEQIERRLEERKANITQTYEDRIRQLEVEERTRRGDAVLAFEEFLKKYPNDTRYTADAMFRLAELYFERSNDAYFVAMREYESAIKAKTQPEPAQPTQHYEQTIDLYQQLISRFPNYRLVDGAYYLLGYCLGEQGEDDQAVATYQDLVKLHPDSRFTTEAYTRIGEYYFDTNELDKAIYAYQQVVAKKDSPFYDKALYKLAWTHYRLDQFDFAVTRFAELLDYADAQAKEKGGKGAGSDLRQEAIQYIAISFSEESWGGVDKAKQFFTSRGNPPWTNEAFAALGDVYFDQTKYPDAIASYQETLRREPNSPDAPKIQDKIVQADDRLRDFDAAAKAREILADNYGKGSPWAQANVAHPDALLAARELAERSLLGSAIFHHRQAQAFKEAKKVDLAKSEYALGAAGYGKYLGLFPAAKNRYELTYYLADCQYYSLQFAAAGDTFAKVRDDDSDDKYLEPSAYSAVLSRERDIQLREARNELAPRPVLKSTDRPDKPVQSSALPPPKQALVDACDAYTVKVPKNAKTPPVSYKAAEIFYAYDQFEEARRRFAQIIADYPDTEVARFAANLTIESYLADKNWDAVEKFSRQVLANTNLSNGKNDFQKDLVKFKLGAMFKKAEQLESDKQYEAAANEYIRLVDDNPSSSFADKALNNAAVDFEKVRRFESATRLYERIPKDFPNSNLADYALFRVGINSERFYDFKKAIDSYLNLVDNYPKSTHRPDALYNAALALENTQQYKRAEDEFQRYAQLFPTRDDAPDMFFRSAKAADLASDRNQAVRNYEQYVKSYGKRKGQDERVVEAYYRIGEIEEANNNIIGARKAYGVAVAESTHRGKGQPFAARAQFALGEIGFRDYDAVKIEGSSKNQKATIIKRAALLTKVRDDYQKTFQYKQVEWTLAALYRIGNLYETFSDTLFAAPPPPEIKKLGDDYVEEYRALLEEQAVPLEDKAVEAYKRTIAEAKKGGVGNDWTKRTLRSLNKLRKKEFPLQKDAKYEVADQTFGIPPLADQDKVAPVPSSASAPAAPLSPVTSTPSSQPVVRRSTIQSASLPSSMQAASTSATPTKKAAR